MCVTINVVYMALLYCFLGCFCISFGVILFGVFWGLVCLVVFLYLVTWHSAIGSVVFFFFDGCLFMVLSMSWSCSLWLV